MAFGTETYRPNGSLAMSGANKAGIYIGMMVIAYNDPGGSQIYTQIPAGYMFVVTAGSAGAGNHEFTIDSVNGYARINWKPTSNGYLSNGQSSRFLIFARRLNNPPAFGKLVYNDENDALLDVNYPVPQFAGTVQPAARATRTFDCSDGHNEGNEHTVTMNLRPNTNRIVLVNMPNDDGRNIWYSCDSFVPAGSGAVTLTLTIIRPYGTPYQVPTLHIFSLDGPISGGGTFGEQYYKADASLVYDSSAENITIRDLALVSYSVNTATMTLNVPASAGVAIPFVEQHDITPYNPQQQYSTGFDRIYKGTAQRQGSEIRFLLRNTEIPIYRDTIGFNTQAGSQRGFAVVVDLAQLNPSSVPGRTSSGTA